MLRQSSKAVSVDAVRRQVSDPDNRGLVQENRAGFSLVWSARNRLAP
jgi:hypothetical protein